MSVNCNATEMNERRARTRERWSNRPHAGQVRSTKGWGATVIDLQGKPPARIWSVCAAFLTHGGHASVSVSVSVSAGSPLVGQQLNGRLDGPRIAMSRPPNLRPNVVLGLR